MFLGLLLALASLLAFSAAQTSTFSVCYKLNGLATGSLDDPYSIAVQFTGLYNSTVQTSVAGRFTPAGQYVQLLSITSGVRQIFTRNSVLVSDNIVGLAPVNTEFFNDNRLYVSNTSQWVDADGIVYQLEAVSQFPGKIYSNLVNLYRSGVYGPVYESESSGIDRNQESFAVNGVPTWTANGGAGFTTCDPDEVPAGLQFQPISGNTVTVALTYHLENAVNDVDGHFTVDFAGSFTSTTFGLDSFGDYYSLVTAASGTRTYCFQSACQTSTVNGVGPVGEFGFVDNQVYGYAPYFTYNGVSYTLSAPVAKPGYALTSTNKTSDVNIYYSKGGLFLEGFGVGGTGPNGGFLTTATSVSVTLSQ